MVESGNHNQRYQQEKRNRPQNVYVVGCPKNIGIVEMKQLFPSAVRVIRLEPSRTVALTFRAEKTARRIAEMEVTVGANRVRLAWGGASSPQPPMNLRNNFAVARLKDRHAGLRMQCETDTFCAQKFYLQFFVNREQELKARETVCSINWACIFDMGAHPNWAVLLICPWIYPHICSIDPHGLSKSAYTMPCTLKHSARRILKAPLVVLFR